MKGKNVTIFGLGAIGGFIGGNVFRLLTITIWLVYQAMCIQTLNMDG